MLNLPPGELNLRCGFEHMVNRHGYANGRLLKMKMSVVVYIEMGDGPAEKAT